MEIIVFPLPIVIGYGALEKAIIGTEDVQTLLCGDTVKTIYTDDRVNVGSAAKTT